MVKGAIKQDMSTRDITQELKDMGYETQQSIKAKKILHDLVGSDGTIIGSGVCLFDWELRKPYLIRDDKGKVYETPAMPTGVITLPFDQEWYNRYKQIKHIIPFAWLKIVEPAKRKRGRPRKNPITPQKAFAKQQQVVDIKTIDVTIEKKSINKSLYEQLSPQDRLDAIADRPFTRWETACMMLGIPQSGLKWLDDLIMISPRS